MIEQHIPLHLTLETTHPAMQWASTQADSIGAQGHTGTHLDCYTRVPENDSYEILGFVVDCTKEMPSPSICNKWPELTGKALLLHTGNIENLGYGTDEYFSAENVLTEESLTVILEKHPAFIVIDAQGIGKKGEHHICMDRLCESCGCHVIENVDLSPLNGFTTVKLLIEIETKHPSSGKPCRIFAQEAF